MNLEISRAFVKDTKILPKRVKLIIHELIHEIQSDKVKSPYDVKDCFKMKGANTLYKIRRGVYRITLEYNEKTAVLKRVLPRGRVYKKHNL
jgi:mRNA-degrading endonuclease RelE of RelBE toxin-antitoxin system